MSRVALLLLALVAVGCGKKKPAADPAPAVPTPADPAPIVPQQPTPPAPSQSDVAKHLKLLKANNPDTRQTAAAVLAAAAQADPAVLNDLVAALSDKAGVAVGDALPTGPNSVRETAVLAMLLAGPKGEAVAVEKGLPILTAALADSDAAVRMHAALALARFRAKAAPAVPKLWPLASDSTVQVREAALRALAEIGTPDAGPLCKLLVHADEGVRITAAENLNDFRPIPPDSVPDLTAAVSDNAVRVRLAAADALGTLGAKAAPAVPALLKALAARTKPDVLELDAFALAALNAVVAAGEPAVPDLTKLLSDKAPLMRYLGAFALGEIGTPAKSAADELAKLQSDRAAEIALEAARALVVSTGDTAKANELIEFVLKHKEINIRGAGVVCVTRMGTAGRPFADKVLPLLDDPDAAVRAAALEFVGTLDAKAAEPALAKVGKLLADADGDTRHRAAGVLLALGPVAAPGAPELAKAASTDTEERVRLTALDALAAIGAGAKAAMPELAKVIADASASTPVRLRAMTVAPVLNAADASLGAAVAKALADKAEDVRGAACLALAELPDPPADAVKKLGDLISSEKSFAGRVKAVRAAAKLGVKAASLKEKLQKAATSEVKDYAFWSKLALASVEGKAGEAEGLARFGLSSAWPAERSAALTAFGGWLSPNATDTAAVVSLSKDRSAATRHAAAVVLARVPTSPAAVARLGELLKDSDPDVRLEAVSALEKLGPAASGALPALRAAATGKDDTARAARHALRVVGK